MSHSIGIVPDTGGAPRASPHSGPIMRLPAARAWDRLGLRRFLPLLVALLGAVAAIAGANWRGLVPPLDVAAVFLVVGAAASVVSRERPVYGAVFVAVLCAAVVAVLYGF